MKFRLLHVCVGILLLVASVSLCNAEVEWKVENTLSLDGTPLDMAVSPDGRLIYILPEDGNIRIYSSDGSLEDTIAIGKQADHIKLGPQGEKLFVSSRQDKTLKVVSLNFIHAIESSDSPSKGLKDAPVIISVFSDFQ